MIAAEGTEAAVRVAFVSPGDAVGGAEHWLLELLEQLGPAWVQEVVTLAEGAASRRFRELGHRVTVIPTSARLGILVSALRLRRALARQDVAVIHANGVKAALVAVLAVRRRGTPVIWMKHDFSWDGRLARFIGGRCRVVAGVSGAVVEVFAGTGVDVRVIPGGVPVYRFDRQAARAALLDAIGADLDAEVVLHVGRVETGKGQLELLEQAPALVQRRPRVRVVFVGAPSRFDPTYATTLARRAQELGVEHAVTMLGARDDAIELMAGADAVAVSSLPYTGPGTGEAFGRVAAEAMAVGTPVVAYAHGGLPELIGDAGLLVAPLDGVGLRDALVGLLADRDRWERMSAAGRERVRRFPVEGISPAMRALYREAATEAAVARSSSSEP